MLLKRQFSANISDFNSTFWRFYKVNRLIHEFIIIKLRSAKQIANKNKIVFAEKIKKTTVLDCEENFVIFQEIKVFWCNLTKKSWKPLKRRQLFKMELW